MVTDKQTKDIVEKHFNVKLGKSEDLYELIMKYGKYTSRYKNVKYTQLVAINRFFNGLPMNCGDWHEHIAAPILRALGYKVNIWLAEVHCANGWYGRHWYIKHTGKRWSDKPFDAVSACLHKPFGTVVCKVVKNVFCTGKSIVD